MKSAGSFLCDSVAGSHCPEWLSGLLCLLLPPLLKADVFPGNVAAFQVLREKVCHWRWAADIEQSVCRNVLSYLRLCYSSICDVRLKFRTDLGRLFCNVKTAGNLLRKLMY